MKNIISELLVIIKCWNDIFDTIQIVAIEAEWKVCWVASNPFSDTVDGALCLGGRSTIVWMAAEIHHQCKCTSEVQAKEIEEENIMMMM